MRLINPSFEILEQGPGLRGIYKQIELAGRTCYKSLDKITDDSAEGFVNRMIKSQHYAMLEHGTVYLKIPVNNSSIGCYHDNGTILASQFEVNPYSKVHYDVEWDKEGSNDVAYVTTNLRVLYESFEDDIDFILEHYLCEPTEFHEQRVTVRFTTSNGIMREFTRHRSHSFAVESTRYCNYSKDKFSNEITFVQPTWCTRDYTKEPISSNKWLIDHLPAEDETGEKQFLSGLLRTESCYMNLILAGRKPQEARDILPLATKCDMVMTGFVSDWQHFFDLRARGTTGAPHPDAKALAEPLMHEFESRKLI